MSGFEICLVELVYGLEKPLTVDPQACTASVVSCPCQTASEAAVYPPECPEHRSGQRGSVPDTLLGRYLSNDICG